MWNPGFRAIRRHQGSFGEIHLTIRYATLRNKLIIVVDACRFLANLFSVWLLKGCAQVFMVPLFPQEPVPLHRERHGLVRPPLFAPRSVLETSQKDTCEEEDGQPRLQREVRSMCLICIAHFYWEYLSLMSRVFNSVFLLQV